jgi:prophage regulatory protein
VTTVQLVAWWRLRRVEVWGFSEVVDFLNVSRARAAVLVNRPDFPPPIADLAQGRIWRADDVRAWERRRRERYPHHDPDDDEL